jgi:hypothetical protein
MSLRSTALINSLGLHVSSGMLLSIDKVNLLQMDKLNNSVDVLQKPTLIGTLNGTSLKYLMYLFNVCHI